MPSPVRPQGLPHPQTTEGYLLIARDMSPPPPPPPAPPSPASVPPSAPPAAPARPHRRAPTAPTGPTSAPGVTSVAGRGCLRSHSPSTVPPPELSGAHHPCPQ